MGKQRSGKTRPKRSASPGHTTEAGFDRISSSRRQSTGTASRVFLGWNTPPLVAAVQWFAKHNAGDTDWNLSDFWIVIPSARARRRFLQLLWLESTRLKLNLTPPEVTTVGDFPENLYDATLPFADEATQLAAWMAAFESVPYETRRAFLPRLTKPDYRRELDVAAQIRDLYLRLGGEGRGFADARDLVASKPSWGDSHRWEVLLKVQAEYLDKLAKLGLADRQASRLAAIISNQCRCDRQLVLLGAVDLNESAKRMLNQVRGCVTSLIFAPEEARERFDNFGCLISKNWEGVELQIRDSQIHIVERPIDEAFAVLDILRDFNGQYSADQITIGVPDDAITPQIELALQSEELAFRRLEGQRFEHLPPVRLLNCLAEFVDRNDFSLFAELVRHPDVFAWLSKLLSSDQWLPLLDKFQCSFLPNRIPLDGSRLIPGGRDDFEVVGRIHQCICSLVKPVLGQGTVQRFAEGWLQILAQLYATPATNDPSDNAGREGQSDEAVYVLAAAFHSLGAALAAATTGLSNRSGENIASASAQIAKQAIARECRASDVLALALAISPNLSSGDDPQPDAIDLAGWLDLPLDDAPVVIVTGVNEGIVPASEPVVPLLGRPLAEAIGLELTNGRYARDLYFMSLISNCRREAHFITGRRGANNDPLMISRLLLSASDEDMVRRANAYFGFKGNAGRRRWLFASGPVDPERTLRVPRPVPVEPIDCLSVTKFREYIKCPYRFYLSEVLGLEPVNDTLRELDGGAFGNLAHAVLQRFGEDPIRDSADAGEISEYLNRVLDEEVARCHLGDLFAAIAIQIESLRVRLRKFSELQANQRSEGWRIVAVEKKLDCHWTINGQNFVFRGRIDRVDRHDDGRFAVWDYKTGDGGVSVKSAHRDGSGNWIDLQLPLYRHLLPMIFPESAAQRDTVGLGYVLLPKATHEIKFDAAEWTGDELAAADKLAREIIGKIQRQVFWPPTSQPPKYSEHFAAICHDNVFSPGTAQ